MKIIGEIAGGVLMLALLAAQFGWIDLTDGSAPAAQPEYVSAPHPWSSGAPDPATVEYQSRFSYRNCTEARAAGAAPIYRGQPGYGAHMDGDSDGIACEPYRGRR